MELRQLRYFVGVVEAGSLGRAAVQLGVVPSTLSQQITRLESELSTRLLVRTARGVDATDAGLAFFRQAQLALRHADNAVREAQVARLSGQVAVGFAPSTAAVLALPCIAAMRERYPEVRMRVVENLSGHLATMLGSRQLDLAVLFETPAAVRLSTLPLLDEQLFVIAAPTLASLSAKRPMRLADLAGLPLVLPSTTHGLRRIVDAAFERIGLKPTLVLEVDGLAILMDVVRSGIAATIQPGTATVRMPADELVVAPIAVRALHRRNVLASLSDDELSPAGLAARVVLVETVRTLVATRVWPGATLHAS